MTATVEIAVGDIFQPVGGKTKYIRDYVDANPGPHPVYSASLLEPFGHVADVDFEGTYLTWVMNGYGGRVQQVAGRFSANRDRGVLLPRADKRIPNLTYLRHILEPQLRAAAVGRRVEGRLNEYTKLYPGTVADVTVELPVLSDGSLDFDAMEDAGSRLERIENRQEAVLQAHDALERVSIPFHIEDPHVTLTLSDTTRFELSIGNRVLKKDHADSGIPIYSANALAPFGHVAVGNLTDFDRPSILWGIDGNFMWNYLPTKHEFATTDHCGRLQILADDLDPFYVYCYLDASKDAYGFDRVFRSSLTNVRSEVEVIVPTDAQGQPDLLRQRQLADEYQRQTTSRARALTALREVVTSRVSPSR
ncbi:hypothetical protein [Aeromicrobium sp. Sec7.5]|uniref:hypothetical protein n=1 Tax=Aeromicrobium sp. Sec7.5 TaxID=3121276 RepID=UPI002FE47D7B